MRNINTIYSPSDTTNISWEISGQRFDSVCLLQKPAADTMIVCSPDKVFFSSSSLKTNNNLLGCLIFTTFFLIVFAFVRLRGKDMLLTLLNVLVKRKKTELILNEGISPNLVCYVLSLLLSFSVISVSINYFAQQQLEPEYIFYTFCFMLLYHFTLLTLIKLLGWTFHARAVAAEVIVNLWTYHIMCGLLIAPFVIALFFVKSFAILPLLEIIIFSLILFYVVKFIRWVEILFAHRVLILYMILYLCALEVMPLLILYKFLA